MQLRKLFSWWIFVLPLLVLLSSSTSPTQGLRVRTIVIDAGHGGKDPGALGKISREKDIALAVALELGETIKKYMPEVKVIYTRDKDVFIPLHERAKIANQAEADLFISIHANANHNKEVYGTETFVMGLSSNDQNRSVAVRENAVVQDEEGYEENYNGFDPTNPLSYIVFSQYQNLYLNQSLLLADKIEHQFADRVNRHSRGVKQAGFLVLWRTTMPSVLVETGFISNANEEKFLNDKLGQTYLASAIFRAVRDYKEEMEAKG